MADFAPLAAELVSADRFVEAGLRAYDELMARLDREEIERASKRMTADNIGHLAEVFADERLAATEAGRKRLERELWDKGFEMSVSAPALLLAFDKGELPVSLFDDLFLAHVTLAAGLTVADAAVPQPNNAARAELCCRMWEIALKAIVEADGPTVPVRTGGAA